MYAIIKSFKPTTEGIEVVFTYESMSKIIPKFSSKHEPSPEFKCSIREEIIGNDKQFELQIQTNQEKIVTRDSQQKLRSDIDKLKARLPENFQSDIRMKLLLSKLKDKRYTYEVINKDRIGRILLSDLSVLEKNFCKEQGLTFEEAVKNKKIVQIWYDKYNSKVKASKPIFDQIRKLEDTYSKQKRVLRKTDPFTVTFQWENFEPIINAFPNENRKGIKKVRKFMSMYYPNLIIFSTQEEVFLQLGIYAYQAGLLVDPALSCFIEEFLGIAKKRLKHLREEDFKSVSSSASDVILKNFNMPLRQGGFWKYVKDTYNGIFKTTNKGSNEILMDMDNLDLIGKHQKQHLDFIDEYSIPEIARDLGIKEATIYKWLEDGKIPSAKREYGKWIINSEAYREIKTLAQGSQAKERWKEREYYTFFTRYINVYNITNLESAKRDLRRMKEDFKRRELSDKRLKRLKKIPGWKDFLGAG